MTGGRWGRGRLLASFLVGLVHTPSPPHSPAQYLSALCNYIKGDGREGEKTEREKGGRERREGGKEDGGREGEKGRRGRKMGKAAVNTREREGDYHHVYAYFLTAMIASSSNFLISGSPRSVAVTLGLPAPTFS